MNSLKILSLLSFFIFLVNMLDTTLQAMDLPQQSPKGTMFHTVFNKTSEKKIVVAIVVEGQKPFVYNVESGVPRILGINLLVQSKSFDEMPSTNILKIQTKNYEYVMTNGYYKGFEKFYNLKGHFWCFERKTNFNQALTPIKNRFKIPVKPIKPKKLKKSVNGLIISKDIIPVDVDSQALRLNKSLNVLSISDNITTVDSRSVLEGLNHGGTEMNNSLKQSDHYKVNIEVYDDGLYAIFTEI